MRNKHTTIDFSYPENIQLIDQAFDLFEWEVYPQDTLSIDEINDFYLSAAHMKESHFDGHNLSNPYDDR